MKVNVIIVLVTLVCASQFADAADWPAFRGPLGNGISSTGQFATSWDKEQGVRWRVELPNASNGSPIVSAGKVFVASADPEGKVRSLLCFDRKSGKALWSKDVEFDKVMPTHKTNPHGSSTPVSDGERVVVWHNSAGLYCYDHSGKQLWSRDLGEFRHMWGYGGSPIIHEDRVILNCGPGKRVFVAALSLNNGETLWELDEPVEGDGEKRESDNAYMGSWSTPVVAKVGEKDQIICTMLTRVNGYDPQSGKLLWSCDGIRGNRGDLAYSSPMIHDGFCVAIGGFSGPSVGFQLGGMGNITEKARTWRIEKNPQSIGTGIIHEGHVYRANAGPGTIECLDPKTGEVIWKKRGTGAVFWGSIVASADGHFYVTDQKGTTLVFKPSPKELVEVARNALGETCNATPALSDGDIFIRTHKALYCVGK